MSEEHNVQVARNIFEAFGRGDAPALLAFVSEDVLWAIEGPSSVPYYGERRGHAGVMDFLAKLNGSVEFERFEPREFIDGGDKIVVLGTERGSVRATNKTLDNDWAMVFTVRDGKVVQFRCYENTAVVEAAFRV